MRNGTSSTALTLGNVSVQCSSAPSGRRPHTEPPGQLLDRAVDVRRGIDEMVDHEAHPTGLCLSHPGANMCSCRATLRTGPRSSTPTSTPSMPRSSSATIPGCGAGRSSSAGEWCSPPATRPRPSASGRPWAAARPGGSAPTPSSSRPASRPTSKPARRCSPCSTTPRRWSRACRSTRRSSTSAACAASPAHPAEIAERLRAAVRERVGLAITVGVARTKFLAKVASGVAKPDGLLVVAPDAELAFLHPLAVERLWGVGQVDLGQAARPGHHHRRRGGHASRRPSSSRCSARRPGRHLHALAHNRDPRPVQVGRRRRSIGSQHALGRARALRGHDPDAVDAVLVSLVDRVTRRLRAARPGRPHRDAAAPLRRLHPGHPLPHAAPADRPHRRDPGGRPRPPPRRRRRSSTGRA